MLFNQMKQDRMQISKQILFFKAMNNTKTNHLAAASWVLQEECVHETGYASSPSILPCSS